MTRVHDVAVIGVGPAGLAAATVTASLGLSTIAFDESPSPGGAIYRALTTTPVRRPEVLGPDYWRGGNLVRAFQAAGAEYLPATSVWGVARRDDGAFDLGVTGGRPAARVAETFAARALVIATGTLERPFPIPGWTLPGVVTAGGVQALLKNAALVPEGRVVFAGSGPLLWQVAWQCLNAGANIDLVLETIPRGRLAAAMRHAPGFMFSGYLARGLELVRSVRRRTRVVEHVEALEVQGTSRVERVRHALDGTWQEAAADSLVLSQGVVPNLHLAAALGCEIAWNPTQACFEPVVDDWGGTTIGNVFVAGDGAGVAGVEAAIARGRLAALAAANALGRIDAAQRDADAEAPRQAVARGLRGRAFLDVLYRPADALRRPHGDTLVCRCEEVTAREVRDAVRAGATDADALATATRCGMGSCQGRFCALTACEIVAEERGVSPAEVGHPRVRFPVRPVTRAEVAHCPANEATQHAVDSGQRKRRPTLEGDG
jgi:NADPH-dependent 2,4-dienoyl-CoA reductase/sulfur reductase-like enzyme/bacterioferritin-associated ferredoxin